MIDRRRYFVTFALVVGALILALQPLRAQQTPVRVPASVLQRYAGEYLHPAGGTVIVTVSGDTLFREVPGQRIAFAPISETLFRTGPVFTAEFVTDKSGGVTQILTDGVGVEFRLPRKGSRAIAAPAVKPARVPVSVLERYVGIYEYIPGQMKRTDLTVAVRLDGDRLVRTMGGQREDVLIPISATRFRVGDTSLITEFVVDDAGVTQVMGTGFQQMLARLNTKR